VVFKLFGWPVEENIKYKDFACFYETLTISETFIESRIRILLRLAISVIGRFSPRDQLLLDMGKVGRNLLYMLWAVYGAIFWITPGFR
jgi:hypothetical protein